MNLSAARRELGTAAVEILALVPLALVIIFGVTQAGVAMWGTRLTHAAARDAARAASLHRDGCAQARASVANKVGVVSCTTNTNANSADVTVRARIPKIIPLMPTFYVTRSASMPMER